MSSDEENNHCRDFYLHDFADIVECDFTDENLKSIFFSVAKKYIVDELNEFSSIPKNSSDLKLRNEIYEHFWQIILQEPLQNLFEDLIRAIQKLKMFISPYSYFLNYVKKIMPKENFESFITNFLQDIEKASSLKSKKSF